MTFPHISVCAHLAETLPGNSGNDENLGKGDNGYNFIVDQQPLGAKLFKQFCLSHKKGNFSLFIYLNDSIVAIKCFARIHALVSISFLLHVSEYYHYNDFLDAVEAYELDLEDNRLKAASDIVKKV